MLPLRLVIDMNVLVSAALKPEGPQRTTLILATTRPARMYVSRSILEEYEDLLSCPELRIRKGLCLQLLQLIKHSGHIVAPTRRLDVCGEPDDNLFPECADKALIRTAQPFIMPFALSLEALASQNATEAVPR